MNDPRPTEGTSRPAGGIVGWVNTDNKGSVVIDNVTTTMGIDGMREAGGIGGVVIGGGTLTISNAYALNKYLNNSTGDLSVNPFFFGEDWWSAFTGTLIFKDNYISGDMMINGKTLAEWLRQTLNDKNYTPENDFTIIPASQNPNNNPDPGSAPDPSNPNPSGSAGPLGTTGIGPLEEGATTSGIATAGQTTGQNPSSLNATSPQQSLPEVETPLSDSATATEVALTPIPLGLGFQTVANTILTLAVGFVTLGIFVLGGFVFWRMYKRRIDAK